MPENKMLNRLAKIADELDARGLYQEADKITSLIKQEALRMAAKGEDKKDSLVNKILSLLEKEEIQCPDCGGNMEFDSDEDNYGMCNCGNENCDCTIDLVDEVENFLNKVDSGEAECPECKDQMQLKDMHCVCVNGKCKCKKHSKEMLLNDLYQGVDFDSFKGIKKASKREDHEYHMARKQLMAAKEAIEDILDAMGDEEEGDIMAWAQSYLTMASDYLQSVKNYMKYGSANLEDEEDGYEENKFATASKKPGNVKLNKPFRTPGGPKKFAVYVKNDKGNIVKVTFGDRNMSIKRDDPNRRKNFRARHNCDTDPRAKDRTTAKYWSCKFWSTPSVSSLLKG